jgi:hypothetical protein
MRTAWPLSLLKTVVVSVSMLLSFRVRRRAHLRSGIADVQRHRACSASTALAAGAARRGTGGQCLLSHEATRWICDH